MKQTWSLPIKPLYTVALPLLTDKMQRIRGDSEPLEGGKVTK